MGPGLHGNRGDAEVGGGVGEYQPHCLHRLDGKQIYQPCLRIPVSHLPGLNIEPADSVPYSAARIAFCAQKQEAATRVSARA